MLAQRSEVPALICFSSREIFIAYEYENPDVDESGVRCFLLTAGIGYFCCKRVL